MTKLALLLGLLSLGLGAVGARPRGPPVAGARRNFSVAGCVDSRVRGLAADSMGCGASLLYLSFVRNVRGSVSPPSAKTTWPVT